MTAQEQCQRLHDVLEHSRTEPEEWQGHCFEAAVKVMELLEDAGFAPTLVHGTPLGGGPWEGIRIGHAWVEVEGHTVIDWTLAPGPLPLFVFYIQGALGEQHVRRYSSTDARRWMLRAKHFGPWESPITEALGR